MRRCRASGKRIPAEVIYFAAGLRLRAPTERRRAGPRTRSGPGRTVSTRPRYHGHRPVTDHFWAPLTVDIGRARQLRAQTARKPGLFADLADRRLLVGFARFQLSFGEGPVVIGRPVDQHDFDPGGTRRHTDAAGSSYQCRWWRFLCRLATGCIPVVCRVFRPSRGAAHSTVASLSALPQRLPRAMASSWKCR